MFTGMISCNPGEFSFKGIFIGTLPRRGILLAILLGCLAGTGCVLDWEEEGNALCGNGKLDPGETCDDGLSGAGQGCSSTCQENRGWNCNGEPSVCTTTCGDGIIAGAEQCDQGPGYPASYDGCSSTCQSEYGFVCSGEPSVCEPGI